MVATAKRNKKQRYVKLRPNYQKTERETREVMSSERTEKQETANVGEKEGKRHGQKQKKAPQKINRTSDEKQRIA